jgi:hypothetical protein
LRLGVDHSPDGKLVQRLLDAADKALGEFKDEELDDLRFAHEGDLVLNWKVGKTGDAPRVAEERAMALIALCGDFRKRRRRA